MNVRTWLAAAPAAGLLGALSGVALAYSLGLGAPAALPTGPYIAPPAIAQASPPPTVAPVAAPAREVRPHLQHAKRVR